MILPTALVTEIQTIAELFKNIRTNKEGTGMLLSV
jgi:hypothetical protein